MQEPVIEKFNERYIEIIMPFTTYEISEKFVNELDVNYEIMLKEERRYEPNQSPIDDILLIKSKVLIEMKKFDEALNIINHIIEEFPNDSIPFPGTTYIHNTFNFVKRYVVLMASKNRDYCPVLKAIIYYKQKKYNNALDILENIIRKKLETDDFSEDVNQSIDVSSHPNLKEFRVERLSIGVFVQTRPDKMALKLLMAIYLIINDNNKYIETHVLYEKTFPNSYKYGIIKYKYLNKHSSQDEKNDFFHYIIKESIEQYIKYAQ